MTNKLFNDILKERKGHYCHALEVYNHFELANVIDEIVSNYIGYSADDYISFFKDIDIYFLEDETLTESENEIAEDELYNFDYMTHLKETLEYNDIK